MAMSLMGIDVGTTGCKAVIFDESGRQLAAAYREYPLLSPHPGWCEIDSRRVLDLTREAVREACTKTNDPVKALAVSSQGEAITPIDSEGNILANSIVSSCPRTADLVPVWEERFGKKYLFEKTGIPVASCFTPLRLEWIKENDPESFERAHKFLFFEDLVFWGMGLEPTSDSSEVSRSMCLDLRTGEYLTEIFDSIGVDIDRLPKVLPSGSVVGKISEKAGKEWGLPVGTVAVTGGHDQPAAALGVGVIEEGQACYGIGTVECVTSVFDKPLLSDRMLEYNLCCYHHTYPGRFVSLAYNFTGGSLFRWYRDVFAQAECEQAAKAGKDVYELLTAQVPDDPTRLFVLPHFTSTGTPYFDNHSTGAILGLSLHTTRGEVIRAILEGITYEIRMCVDLYAEIGHPIQEFRCSGGGSKSKQWMQIKADIMNAEILVPEVSEAGCLGMAMLAGAAIGVYNSLEEAVATTVKVTRSFSPNPKHVAVYEENMAVYRDLYPTIKDLAHRITALRS
jgi:xylulokinase